MIEVIDFLDDGTVVSEIESNGHTDIFVYANPEALSSRLLVRDLPPDMRYTPKNTFGIMDVIKLIPKLRPEIRDRKFGFVLLQD